MYINRESEIWKTAPFHIKVSAFGTKTVKTIRRYKKSCFCIGLVGIVLANFGLLIPSDLVHELGMLFFPPFWIGACMYSFLLDWLRDNP